MFPDNPGLLGLNVNGGQKILLRLRPHHAPDTFLEFDDVIGTMLHEVRLAEALAAALLLPSTQRTDPPRCSCCLSSRSSRTTFTARTTPSSTRSWPSSTTSTMR